MDWSVARPSRRVPVALLLLVAVLCLGAWFLVERRLAAGTSAYYLEATAAARQMQNAMNVIYREKERLGILQDPAHDPNRTGLIGPEVSPLLTTLGQLQSKRTATNPDLAAAITEELLQNGVTQGSPVIVVLSGSFVGANVAVLAALETVQAQPFIINSVGGSMYGAIDPQFTWLDMQQALEESGVVRAWPGVAIPGGYDAIGVGLDEEGMDLIRESAERTGETLLMAESLGELVDEVIERLESRSGAPIQPAMLINVGGSMLGLGNCTAIELPEELVTRRPVPCEGGEPGLVTILSNDGVPVMNVLNLRFLALQLGLPYDPIPLPTPGNNPRVYGWR